MFKKPLHGSENLDNTNFILGEKKVLQDITLVHRQPIKLKKKKRQQAMRVLSSRQGATNVISVPLCRTESVRASKTAPLQVYFAPVRMKTVRRRRRRRDSPRSVRCVRRRVPARLQVRRGSENSRRDAGDVRAATCESRTTTREGVTRAGSDESAGKRSRDTDPRGFRR